MGQQHAHRYAQRDVDHVVDRATAVRETRQIAAQHSRSFCDAIGVTAVLVFRRSSSAGVAFAGWFNPATPVRNADSRSVRG